MSRGQRRGLVTGKTVSLDRATLISYRYGLTSRPDRLIQSGGSIIVEEWKFARTLRPWHRVQMGVYFVLIEDQLRIRPSHGFIVCGVGARYRIDNDEALRVYVLDLAGKIRRARVAVDQPIPVMPKSGQCWQCGMREHCGRARV